jgi:hypothetical protein
MKVTLSITFDSDRDREILRRLAAEPNRSAAIRTALRQHYMPGFTLEDIQREIRELSRIMRRVDLISAPPAATGEPPDLADALDSLGTS